MCYYYCPRIVIQFFKSARTWKLITLSALLYRLIHAIDKKFLHLFTHMSLYYIDIFMFCNTFFKTVVFWAFVRSNLHFIFLAAFICPKRYSLGVYFQMYWLPSWVTDSHCLNMFAGVYTIEFKKRGLPHAHIVLWLATGDKLISSKEIDNIICAEIPDKESDPIGYEAIAQFMMHGPCGEANPRCPCMVNGRCMKYYPKPYTSSTTMDSDGYASYRRRDTWRIVECKKIHLDNRYFYILSSNIHTT